MKDLDRILNTLFAAINPKERKVIEGRFGIKNGRRSTLQKIGNQLGVTRERVRQIEEQGIRKLKPKIEKEATEIIEQAKTYLGNVGGVRRDDCFINDLKYLLGVNETKVKYADEKLRFLLSLGGVPLYHKEDDEMYGFWYSDENSKNKFLSFVKKITKFLKSTNKKEILERKTYLAECRTVSSCHLLTIPKYFKMNVFGDFGFKSWPEIEPKTIRDKAYLVLLRHGKPLHFTQIAKYINHFGIDEKPAHVQTVHNELIKDSRFVLVGRGIYALGEHGFEPGTVREVISRLLKQKGPLKSSEIIRLVAEQRILKENTILFNLQNRRHFRRLDDGRYHLKEV